VTEQARRSATSFAMAGLGVDATAHDTVDTGRFFDPVGVPPVVPATPDAASRSSDDALELILRSSRFTPAEAAMLMLLMGNPRRPVARHELTWAAFERDWHPLSRAIDVHIVNLRRKIDPDPLKPSLIRTVRGIGYMYVPEVN
jgi:hypothetical protein